MTQILGIDLNSNVTPPGVQDGQILGWTSGQLQAIDPPAAGLSPVIPMTITKSQTIPTGCAVLMYDGCTINSGVQLVFQGTAQAIFIKQLQLR